MEYEVIVGNIGSVLTTDDYRIANEAYHNYILQSKNPQVRVFGEDVYLFQDGEPIREYDGHLGGMYSEDDVLWTVWQDGQEIAKFGYWEDARLCYQAMQCLHPTSNVTVW